MTRPLLVIADDFTGGNSVAAGLAELGCHAVTVLGSALDNLSDLGGSADAVVVCTGTRNSTPGLAANAVRDVVRAAAGFPHVSLRIDSTLRGPIAESVHSLLRHREAQTRRKAVGICVAAHPAAGRQTINGKQLLWGREITATELAHDARSPVTTASVVHALSHPELTLDHLGIDCVRDTRELDARLAASAAGHDVVIVDASEADDIRAIAEAAARVVTDLEVVAIDPGPFTVELARSQVSNQLETREDARPARGGPGPVIAVVGSASELTERQLARLSLERDVTVIEIDVDSSGRLRDAVAIPEVITTSLQADETPDVVAITARQAQLEDQTRAPERLVASLAAVAAHAVSHCDARGVFCTGGDTTQALLEHVGARGVEVSGEVVPLATWGWIVGGAWSGMPIVTKGGLVGDTSAIDACVAQLERMSSSKALRTGAERTITQGGSL